MKIPTEELKFRLDPVHVGRKVVYKKAQDRAFYHRVLADPKLIVWVLVRDGSVMGYTGRRLFEVGYQHNVQIEYVYTSQFEIRVSSEGLDKITYRGKPVQLPDCGRMRMKGDWGERIVGLMRE